jgi:hypothetical protein
MQRVIQTTMGQFIHCYRKFNLINRFPLIIYIIIAFFSWFFLCQEVCFVIIVKNFVKVNLQEW